MNWGRIFFDLDLFTGVSRRLDTMRRRKGWPGPLFWRRGAWRRSLMMLTSQLSAIVRCNAPLVPGLEKAIADRPPLKLTQAIIALSDDLSSGMRLADAMAQCPRFYPAWYVDLIRTGESTGSLEHALSAAGEHLATQQRFNKTAQGWTLYLVFVFTVQFSIALFLFHYIVPEFAQLYKDFGSTLPGPLADMNRFLDSITVTHVRVAVLVCLCSIAWWLARRIAGERRIPFSRIFTLLASPIPYIGTASQKIHLARVCGVLEQLAAARLPINEALGDCAALNVPGRIRRALQRTRARVEQGQSFSDALKPEHVFPDSFITMLSLGEASGRLEDAARHLREMYEQQYISSVRMALDIAGPIGVLGLGAIALVIYGGMFMALVSIADVLSTSI